MGRTYAPLESEGQPRPLPPLAEPNRRPFQGLRKRALLIALIAGLVVIGLILWVEIDNRMQRQQLAKLKEQGASRRSEKTAAPSADKPAESTA